MFVYTPLQLRQLLYEDLSIPIISPFLSNPIGQNLQPLATIHPTYNPLKTSGILPAITYSQQPKSKSQNHLQNKPSPSIKDKKIHWIKF